MPPGSWLTSGALSLGCSQQNAPCHSFLGHSGHVSFRLFLNRSDVKDQAVLRYCKRSSSIFVLLPCCRAEVGNQRPATAFSVARGSIQEISADVKFV